jgi:hypothetical protein
MATGQTLLLVIALVVAASAVAISATAEIAKDTDPEPDEGAAKKKARAHPTPEDMSRGGVTPDEVNKRKKWFAIFAAIVEPPTPKNVTFPLSEEDNLKFHSAREGLMQHASSKAKDYDLNNADTKKKLRESTRANQEKMRQLLLASVKAGKSLQQSRVGLIVAQFEALNETEQKEAMAKAKKHFEQMPPGARDKAMHRQTESHKRELAQIQSLRTDTEREAWFSQHYPPQINKMPKMLKE